MSEDPIEERDGNNLYTFARNTPTEWVDWLGLANYRVGQPQEPPITFDEDFVFDPSATPTLGDRRSWLKWKSRLKVAELLWPGLVDATRAYRHYLDGTGTDLEIDYRKAYKEDGKIVVGVDNEIEAAQNDAERLWDKKSKSFQITGQYVGIPNGTSENWQKTIGAHHIWGSADVTTCTNTRDEFVMVITIREKDRYNFNRGAADIASGLPDNENGRFAVLGWARSFITNGSLKKKVTWIKGRVVSTSKMEDVQ